MYSNLADKSSADSSVHECFHNSCAWMLEGFAAKAAGLHFDLSESEAIIV